MPKGAQSKRITLGYTTFHRCPCGYDIEDASADLVAMKKRLHRKKCNEWKDAPATNYGVIDLPPCMTPYNVNRERHSLSQLYTPTQLSK